MSYCKSKVVERLEYNQLFDEFLLGCKPEQKIGMEYERIPIYKSTGQQVPYDGEFGICNLLREFAKNNNWDYILDESEIIGLKQLHNTITLEPGCQLELSIEPQKKIDDLRKIIKTIDTNMSNLLNKFGIELLNVGVSPKTTYKNINLIPKKRYHIMANYLWGILSDVMMRETAGIQVGIDYLSEQDAMRKFRLANLLMPFMTAIYCNSNKRGGVDTGYKSFRALAWLNTDNERCGFATTFNTDMCFKDYVDKLLDIPMIMIKRDEGMINLHGVITFRQFMLRGYDGYKARLEDWQLHSSLYFPEVRLRNFIEIRNHDCVGAGLEYSIPAIYKGIMYSKSAIEEVENIVNKFTLNDIKELRYSVAKNGIYSKINKMPILNVCKELISIAYESLKINNEDEESFIEPIIEMLKQGKMPFDLL